MKHAWWLVLLVVLSFAAPTFAQDIIKRDSPQWMALQRTLANADAQWLCAGKYYKPKMQECVDSRAKFWPQNFFEVGQNGQTHTKAEMVASQTANARKHPNVVRGEGPNPQDFKLMSVYGNIALGTDLTVFKTADASGHLSVSGEANCLRMFVKENGEWRPAGAVLIPVAK